jgi:hypothetical protein
LHMRPELRADGLVKKMKVNLRDVRVGFEIAGNKQSADLRIDHLNPTQVTPSFEGGLQPSAHDL